MYTSVTKISLTNRYTSNLYRYTFGTGVMTMNSNSTKKIVLNGVMIALVFLGTYLTRIPTPLPGGYFNLGDAVIMVAAITLGRKSGLIAGAIGSCLADIAFGGFMFAPITLIVKGLEGYLVGVLAASGLGNTKASGTMKAVAVIVGAAVMVFGYFFAEAFILSLFDKSFGLAAAITELPANLIQGGLSAVVGYALALALIKMNVQKYAY